MTAGEEPVASAEGDAAHRVFGDVVVGFEPGVGSEAGERVAPLDCVAQRLGQCRSCREFPLCRLRPGEERIEWRRRDAPAARRAE